MHQTTSRTAHPKHFPYFMIPATLYVENCSCPDHKTSLCFSRVLGLKPAEGNQRSYVSFHGTPSFDKDKVFVTIPREGESIACLWAENQIFAEGRKKYVVMGVDAIGELPIAAFVHGRKKNQDGTCMIPIGTLDNRREYLDGLTEFSVETPYGHDVEKAHFHQDPHIQTFFKLPVDSEKWSIF